MEKKGIIKTEAGYVDRQGRKDVENNLEKCLQSLRELAIGELFLSDEAFADAVSNYLGISVYNRAAITKTTLSNVVKEAKAKKELKELLGRYDLEITKKMLQIVQAS